MTDADLRALERLVKQGDPEAQARLNAVQKRIEVPFSLFCENQRVAAVLRQLSEGPKGWQFHPQLVDAGHHREAKSPGFSMSCKLLIQDLPQLHAWASEGATWHQVNFTINTWHRCSARVLFNKAHSLHSTDDHADCEELTLWISEPCPVHQSRHVAV